MVSSIEPIAPLSAEEKYTHNGKKGIWRMIRGHRTFIPDGTDDVREVFKQQHPDMSKKMSEPTAPKKTDKGTSKWERAAEKLLKRTENDPTQPDDAYSHRGTRPDAKSMGKVLNDHDLRPTRLKKMSYKELKKVDDALSTEYSELLKQVNNTSDKDKKDSLYQQMDSIDWTQKSLLGPLFIEAEADEQVQKKKKDLYLNDPRVETPPPKAEPKAPKKKTEKRPTPQQWERVGEKVLKQIYKTGTYGEYHYMSKRPDAKSMGKAFADFDLRPQQLKKMTLRELKILEDTMYDKARKLSSTAYKTSDKEKKESLEQQSDSIDWAVKSIVDGYTADKEVEIKKKRLYLGEDSPGEPKAPKFGK